MRKIEGPGKNSLCGYRMFSELVHKWIEMHLSTARVTPTMLS